MYKEIDRNKLTTALILVGFFLLVVLVVYFYGILADWGYGGIFLGLIIATPSVLIGYYTSDLMVLSMAGAHEINRSDNPQLFTAVENLAITDGLPMPKIYIIDDPAMNAFATGRDYQHAVVAITTGLLSKLNKTELQGVIAHELSHIKNYDTRLSTVVVIFVGLIAILADWFFRLGSWGRRDSRRDGSGILALLGIVFIILSPLVAKLIQLALSRNREFLADSEGALLTRYPEGLASALEKIAGQQVMIRRTNSAMNHLFIADPIKAAYGGENGSWWSNLFATHPPTEERIKRLRSMI